MASRQLLCFTFVFSLLFTSTFAANVAWNKSISAEHSCGVNKSELYFTIDQEPLLPFQRNISTCDQNDAKNAHPPEAMVDGKYTTFWQSESSRDDARITIDLSGLYQKFYYVKNIIIQFGDFYRPKQMAFYKKSSSGGEFEPWHYVVTESESCQDVFNVSFQDSPGSPNSVLCAMYINLALQQGQVETVELQGGRGIIVNNDGTLNTNLLDWMNTSVVEIRFSGLHLKFDHLAKFWRHYAVREINVTGYCDCNGHADGMNCPYNTRLRDRQCKCQEGACGVQCEQCCPGYNQYPYRTGKLGPFETDEDAACEKCNCHNHADVCVYNETIANNMCSYNNNATNDACSMDMHGKYSGGGVCIDCKNNTEGINCQRCVTQFYRPDEKSQWDKDACQACECFQSGTRNTTLYGTPYTFLDCVRDREEADKLVGFGLTPGQCFCKNKTTGRQCDHCVDGYYNLTGGNLEGCLACHCNTIGTSNGSIVCNDNGVCYCKDNVQGIKCDECVTGTFNMADENQDGCTTCICSGITTNCTSTSLLRSQVQHKIAGWKLVNDLASTNALKVMSIKDEVSGKPVDMISFNITTEQTLFWMANESYFNDESKVDSYGGYLSFAQKVTSLPGRALKLDRSIVLKGPRNISIQQFLPPLLPGVSRTIRVKMVEFNWTVVESGALVDRSTFILILARIKGIWITASYYNPGSGIYQISFGNVQLSSVSNQTNFQGLRAVDVEQCSCSEEYDGLSCERCARSYHRENVTEHAFFGVCVRCNCNGHTPDCDPDTGKCLNCDHNTTGFQCERCQDGFYGVATNGTSNDCQKCPCEAPRTTDDLCVRLDNGSAKCSNCAEGYEANMLCNRCEWGYFGRPDLPGGNCSRCQCNDNSGICDRETGSCLGYCQNNATGWHCERCENGTYGDATKQQCRDCTCDETGSHDNICNHVTGVCSCKENVEGFNCSACMENSYGFSPSGCTQCGCNPFGVTSLQCNNTGICQCRNFTHGEKCDACDDTYYGLPTTTCQECSCNATGSNDTICNHVTGQCPCKAGVAGRQCDTCKVQYKGFSDQGCEPCPACTMKLQSKVDEANTTLLRLNKRIEEAKQSLYSDSQLDELQQNITRLKALQKEYHSRARIIQSYRQLYPNNSLNSTIMDIEQREVELRQELVRLQTQMTSEIKKKEVYFNEAESSYNVSRDVAFTTQTIIEWLEVMRDDLTTKKNSSFEAVQRLNNSLNAASMLAARYTQLTLLVQESVKNTTDAVAQVNNQTNELTKVNETLNDFKIGISAMESKLENEAIILSEIQSNVTRIEISLSEVNDTIRETGEILGRRSHNVTSSNQLVVKGTQNYQDAKGKLEQLYQRLDELKREINNVNTSIISVRGLARNASDHTELLTAEAEALNMNYSAARRHGERAVWSIERYNELEIKIASSLTLSRQANASVHELISLINNMTLSSASLSQKVSESLVKSEELLAETKARNINITGLDSEVSQAYEIFSLANTTCRNVRTTSDFFDDKVQEITTTSTTLRPVIFSLIQNATATDSKAQNLSIIVEYELITLRQHLNKITEAHSNTSSLLGNVNNLIENTSDVVNQTDSVLSNVTKNVNATHNIRQRNDEKARNLTERFRNLELKLKAAQEKVAKFRLAMRLKGNTSVKLPPTPRSISNPFLNEISLDFKTNSSSGLLFYMASDPNNTDQSVVIKVANDFVNFTYTLGAYPVTITNWEVPIDDDVWHRVYATRYRDTSRLTVINLESGYFRTFEKPSTTFHANLEMQSYENTSIFLGGLPLGLKADVTNRYFDGDLDNFILNQDKVPIWEPVAVEGIRRFAAKRTIFDPYYDTCVTFHGNGFIRQLAGKFETRSNSSLQFQFRTFFKTASLLVVQGNKTQPVYQISLKEGQVLFQYSNITLASRDSNYATGTWYAVSISRTLKNASLYVTSLSENTGPGPSKTPDRVTHSTRLPIYLPDAKYIYFGGTNDTSNRFAGGMKYVQLSSVITNGLVRIYLNETDFADGVSFDKCLSDVEEGLAYSEGYTALNSEDIGTMESLSIRFKTSEPSGLLAYGENQDIYFYLALFHGNIYLIYANGSTVERLQTKTETLNEKQYHIVDVIVKQGSIQLKVDSAKDGEQYTRTLPNGLPSPVPLQNRFYIGGIEESMNIPFNVPVSRSFRGDINYVNINENRILDGSSPSPFKAGTSTKVSASGVPPAPASLPPTVAPTNPPTCAGQYPEKYRNGEPIEVHFPGSDSFLLLKPNQTLLETMGASFVLALEVRALSPNGVLFLAVDNATHPTQFVSLELVDGHIVYQFNTGNGLVRIKTAGNYAIGGLWYTINLLRIHQFGAMVVPENKEYHRNTSEGEPLRLNVTQMFVGGVYNDVETSMLENPSAPSFFGCIRKFSIQTHLMTHALKLTGNPKIQAGRCYAHVQPQVGFNGTGYAKLDGPYSLSGGSNLSIRFRTSERSGLLFYAMDLNNNNRMVLEKLNGRIIVTYYADTEITSLEWTDPDIPSSKSINSSFAICDNKYHTVTVNRTVENVKLMVNNKSPKYVEIGDSEIHGPIYVGGVPSGLNVKIGSTGKRLVGCVESVIINNHMVDFKHDLTPKAAKIVEFGCRAPNKPRNTYSDFNPLQVFTLV